jgi:PAT family beta-lactamase induction signal transducer AmpG
MNNVFLISSYRIVVVLFLGFASGLPLALTGQAMQAWLTTENIDLTTIGFLSLVGIPYTFKFLWAPLTDRFNLPFFPCRRGWIWVCQWLLALALLGLSWAQPQHNLATFAAFAMLVAFLSATQDIVIDAYRTELLPTHERGLGASGNVMGYRLAMIVSGGLTFIWTDTAQDSGWTWPEVYQLMAVIMAIAGCITLLFLPRQTRPSPPPVHSLYDALGLKTLSEALTQYFIQPHAWAFLVLIILYKLGDAFAGSLMTSFLLKGMAFSSAEIGVANKLIGLWLTIGGTLLGGLLMLRLGLWQALMGFGCLQMLSNLGFWWLSVAGAGALPSLSIPAFDWGFIRLANPTTVDGGLLVVIAAENISSGMGAAAFVALLMSLCQTPYTATHFALLSALAAIGRVWVGPAAGFLSDRIGWSNFFILSTVCALPSLVLLGWMFQPIKQQERKQCQ